MFEQQVHQIDTGFTATTVVDAHAHMVHLSGELDLAGRRSVLRACVPRVGRAVVVDMSDLTFMDCAGYGALVAARRSVERRGGALTLAHATGQPARLIGMIERAA